MTGEQIQILIAGLRAVEKLISESCGVAGLHRNGEFAPWDELRVGGRYEDWLVDFDTALELAETLEKQDSQ